MYNTTQKIIPMLVLTNYYDHNYYNYNYDYYYDYDHTHIFRYNMYIGT